MVVDGPFVIVVGIRRPEGQEPGGAGATAMEQKLTEREWEIAVLVAYDMTRREIALVTSHTRTAVQGTSK